MKYFISKKVFKNVCFVLFAAVLFTSTLSCYNNWFQLPEKVKIKTGLITGVEGNDPSVMIFKGIPYAAPPVGNLRWKAPQPPTKWKGVRACDTFGANAMQAPGIPFLMFTEEFLIRNELGLSEDCLTLNVWTDKKSTDGKRPVVMYIHGGGFNAGSGSCAIYDGEGLAKKEVVVVTINYRIGIFGFMAHPELSAESSKGVSGNYGLLDMIAALKWIRNNIEAFGGDPYNVTIQGQSAGSAAVQFLIASPLAKGLFQRAIAESGNNLVARATTLASEEAKGLNAMTTFGKISLAEMRAMTQEDLQAAALAYPSGNPFIPGFPVSVVTDGYVVPDTALQIYKDGKQNDVELLTGSVSGDAGMFGSTTVSDLAGYNAYAAATFGSFGLDDDFLAAYPAGDVIQANAQLASSGIHKNNMLLYGLAKARALHENSKTYIYYFTHVLPTTGIPYGAFHSSDISYFFDYYYQADYRPWTQVDYDLGDAMSSYVANFARTGNPNGCGLTLWPAFSASKVDIIEFGDTIQMYAGMDSAQVAFWNLYLNTVLGL